MSSPRGFRPHRGHARRGAAVARARLLWRRPGAFPEKLRHRSGERAGSAAARPSLVRRLEERPAGVPRFWRRVDDNLFPVRADSFFPALSSTPHEGPALKLRASSRQLDLWLTVLSAGGIPFRLGQGRGAARRAGGMVYVPPLLERRAQADLRAVAAERPGRPPAPEPIRRNAHWVFALLLALVVWHGLRVGWWEALTPASAPLWIEAGAADVFRILRRHEWHRAITALTLHGDSGHLFANVLFGAPFLALLCRRVGLGTGLALALGAGALGNVLNSLYQPLGHSSIGFSTALFGAVGALSGLTAARGARAPASGRRWRQAVLPLAMGGGVLAMLGAEGGTTDYGAHLFGLAAGLVLGGAAGLASIPSRRAGLWAGALALLLVVLAWWRALTP